MKGKMARMMKKGSRRSKYASDATSTELLETVWSIRGEQELLGARPTAYIDHYNNLVLMASPLNAFNDHKHALELIDTVRNHASSPISEVLSNIQRTSANWIKTSFDQHEAVQALQFANRLWLFSSPSLEKPSLTLVEANKIHLENSFVASPPRISATPSTRMSTSVGLLSPDFSAKSLTRKGGFYLVWTSDLSEHLTFASKDQLRVFRHTQVLQKYQRGVENAYYPDGFLEETYRTIHLLFPFEDYKTSKRVKRIAIREHVDIEAAMAEKAIEEYQKFQIANYQYYGSRLTEIQQRYDLARPHRLSQWWYDRRQRPEWAALMVALIVFLLTVLFGIAQTITGVLQVIASWH